MNRIASLVSISCALLLPACASDTDEQEDGVDDTISDGKTDGFGVAEGTPEACGVLHVANTATLAELADDIGLTRRAATNIVAERPFVTLAELDTVPYVGPIAFGALLEFAEESGQVEACGSGPSHPPPTTCQAPSGAFGSELLPKDGYLRVHGVALQSGPSGVRPLIVGWEPTTLSYENRFVFAYDRTATGWSVTKKQKLGARENTPTGYLPPYLFTTARGDDECYAYATNAQGRLFLDCSTLGNQVVTQGLFVNSWNDAPLAVARNGGERQLVFREGTKLVWRPYTTAPATPEVITQTATTAAYRSVRIAVDSQGHPHVAWIEHKSYAEASVVYATRGANGWSTTTIEPALGNDYSYPPDRMLALTLVDDKAVVAYHHRGSRGLRYARQRPDGSFDVKVLVNAPPEFPDDRAGALVALETDCTGQVHIAYLRSFTNDPRPSTCGNATCPSLRTGRIVGDQILDDMILQQPAHPSTWHGLDYHIDASGHELVLTNDVNGATLFSR
ncbi:MAG: hypothetical protein SFX73_38525 [Kofleriaceae bacterium]|nr:hypothetical protein [Kofleriaceae bacterium]